VLDPVSRVLGPGVDHLDPISISQPFTGGGEEAGSPFTRIEEHTGRAGPLLRENKAGDAATAAEVEEPTGAGADGVGERERVLEVTVYIPRPEEAEPLRVLENRPERLGPGTVHRSTQRRRLRAADSRLPAQARRSTTRRRGSSPSDTVVTPSISATASCTIFRSEAPIGSSA